MSDRETSELKLDNEVEMKGELCVPCDTLTIIKNVETQIRDIQEKIEDILAIISEDDESLLLEHPPKRRAPDFAGYGMQGSYIRGFDDKWPTYRGNLNLETQLEKDFKLDFWKKSQKKREQQ